MNSIEDQDKVDVKQIAFRLSNEERKLIADIAHKECRSVSAMCKVVLLNWANNYGKETQ